MSGSIHHKPTGIEDDTLRVAEADVFLENKGVTLDDGLGPKWMLWKRRRYLVLLLAFFGEVMKEALRTNLTVAVFPMTENHSATDENGSTIYVQDFDWDVKTRGILLSILTYGFVLTHMLGGILAVQYGGSKLYGLGVAIAAFSTLLTPAAAYVHFYVLVSLRLLEGMCEGVLGPSLEILFARWIPMQERSSFIAVVMTGDTWGAMFGMSVSSAIAHQWGWPAIFYFTGGFGILWVLAWFLIVKEDPALEKKMSRCERIYIQHSKGRIQLQNRKMSSIPFTKIVTSIPLLGLFFGCLSLVCMYVMLTTQLPAYMKDVLKLETQNAGYASSFPLLGKVLTMYCSSPIVDWLVNKNIFTTTVTRKIVMCGGLTIMAVTGFLIQQATSVTAAIACLVIINMCSGAISVQVWVNMLDLAPKYSCVLAGLLFTAITACAMLIPTLIGYLTQNKTAEEWHTVFSILAGLCLLGAVMYGLLGSGQLQPWATELDNSTADGDLTKRVL